MTTVLSPEIAPPRLTVSNLYRLTNCLISSVVTDTSVRKNSFVNDIPTNVGIEADHELVATVLSGLLSTVDSHARDSYIRLSAKVYNNVVVIHVKNYNHFPGYDIYHGLQQLLPLAEKLKGYVGVCSQREQLTTIAFSFPNLPLAA